MLKPTEAKALRWCDLIHDQTMLANTSLSIPVLDRREGSIIMDI